jgi:tetratricopeptide (TPR) repeat protein
LNQAVAVFREAIAEDPKYAEAWAGLSFSYTFLADAYRAPSELLAAMREAAEKAVTLDEGLADGHAYLGYILLAYERDFPAARRQLERAGALNPGSTDVHLFAAMARLAEKNPRGAHSELEIAARLDPLNPWLPYVQVWVATAQGDYAGALKAAQRTVELDPAFVYFTSPLTYVYGSFGRWKQCISAARSDPAGVPDYKVAVCHAHNGQTAVARDMLARLEAASRTRYVDRVTIAEIKAALGDRDGALAALDQAYRDRSYPLLSAWFLPEFKPLHDDPRFQRLMERIYASRPETSH